MVKAILFLPKAIAATPPNGHIYSNQLKLKKLQLPGETLCSELEQFLNQPNMSVRNKKSPTDMYGYLSIHPSSFVDNASARG